MPRPKKTATDARSHVISFRLTDSERGRLQSEADVAGVPANDLARFKVTDGRVRLRVQTPASGQAPGTTAILQQLTRVGVNLNQIARKLNTLDQHEPAELRQACNDLDEILRRLLATHRFR